MIKVSIENLAMFVDSTKRKQAEAEVLKVKNDWEHTFEAVPDLICIVDKNYRILRVNKARPAD